MSIQQRLDTLQPYVQGIRYSEGITVIDVVFRDTWTIPVSKTIKSQKGGGNLNYHMFFSDDKTIGIDEILDHIDNIIKLNLEKEQKYELLKIKVDELKLLFKSTSLIDLNKLKFVIGNEDVTDNITIDDVHNTNDEIVNEIKTIDNQPNQLVVLPPKSEKELADELEFREEEARAAAFKKKQEEDRINKTMNKKPLEPKNVKNQKIVVETYDIPNELKEGDCNCGEYESCLKCIDHKSF